jgi:3',5'-cyclic-AMP phosphodiesterase
VNSPASGAKVFIAQISDLHIKPPGELAYGKVDTAAALSRCVNELNRFQPRPHLVVISGDLVDTPSQAAYDHLIELLAPLEIPYAAIPGNHDDRTMLGGPRFDHGFKPWIEVSNRTVSVADLDVVLIDSAVPGKNYGLLDAQTLAWLDSTLGSSAKRPGLLFLHHPPWVTGIAHMDAQNLRNGDDLAVVLRKHERVQLVAAGHIHRAMATTFAGVLATVCPALNHAVALDLDAGMPPSFKIEPPAFHLHAWFPGNRFGKLVTHWVPIGDFAGPYPFHDNAGKFL